MTTTGHSSAFRVGCVGLTITVLTAAFLVIAWQVTGERGFVIAWVTHFVLMAWSAVAGIPRQVLTMPWFRVRAREPRIYRALGVRGFDRALTLIGWNRLIAAERTFDGSRSGLPELDHSTRKSEVAHLACTVVTCGIAVATAVSGLLTSALWVVGLAIPLHLYPVMLQRLLRSRIDGITGKITGKVAGNP